MSKSRLDHHVLVLALLRLPGRWSQERQSVGGTMSSDNPIDLRQDRRKWLKTSAAAVGASLLPFRAVAMETPQAETAPAAPHAVPAPESKAPPLCFPPQRHAQGDE